MKRDERRRTKRHRTSRRQKVEWLRDKRELWELPAPSVAQALLKSGLYAVTTRRQDINVRRLIQEVRG